MDPLLDPFQIRHLSLRNRIVSAAHAPSYQQDGHPKDRYRLYHEAKAKGGVGLTIIGGSTNIAPDSPSVFGQLYAGDDSIVPWFQKLTSGVKSHGAAIMCQITHMGRRTAWDDGHWLPVAGPSPTRERAHRAFPKAMEIEDIERVVHYFALAAKRCQDGGFDGIELLSHSHLLGQFLSPLVNHRQDEYGGSLENRLRLTMQVIQSVRDAVGPEMILGMRITGDELVVGGLDADECVEIAQQIAGTGEIDFLNVLAGAPYDDLGLAVWVSPMGLPSAPHLSIAGRIRAAVDLPILHAGGVADIATARHAITQGHVDLIGMTRAQMADPYLVAKLEAGVEDQIRPCVGLGYCVDRVNQGKPAVCGHNAATGREATMSHVIAKAENQRRVVVVGGGPAGLEAARISAERGHSVTLYEASDRLGGQVNLAAKGTTRRQIWGVADWLISEVARLGVKIHMNSYIEAEDVMAAEPDVVILATGGVARLPEIENQNLLISSWEVLGGEKRVLGEVLLFDDVGDHAALVCADVMARAGHSVRLVTPDRMVAHDLGPTNSAVVLRDLAFHGVKHQCFSDLVLVSNDKNRKRVVLRDVLTDVQTEIVVDHVVTECGTEAIEDLYYDLKSASHNSGQLDHKAMIAGNDPFRKRTPDGQYYLARIGDAVASRNIHAALFDALRVCKGL